MNALPSSWNEERLVKLKKLWGDGLSISKIGEELGVSRNAIAGKAHRLGLPKRQSPIIKSSENKDIEIGWNEKKRGPKPLRLALRELNWSRNKCLWPSGDPKTIEFSFCGDNVVAGRPYCSTHCQEAYNHGKD